MNGMVRPWTRCLCSVFVSAYEIWVASGGDAEENWLRAEAEFLKNSNSSPVSSPIKKKRRATAT